MVERTQQGPAWPAYGRADAPPDPLQRTLDADLSTRTPPAGGRHHEDARAARPSARRAVGPPSADRVAAAAPAAPRDRGFWASLRRGLLPGAGVVLVVLVVGRVTTGLGPESPAVVVPYAVTLVVGPLLGVVCAVGWARDASRRRAARAVGDPAPVRPSRVLGGATTVLGVVLAALVATPLWVAFSG
ncbi:hypothetical protein [Cellulosimicrobium sp. Marseille-Q8652]